MRGLYIHKNRSVSVTKLTLGLRVGFTSSHLTANKLFPVNQGVITGPPNMSLLLKAKSMPALIIKPRLRLLTYTDDLGWYITSNQQGQMLVQNLNRIVGKPNVTPWQSVYCNTHCISVVLMFQENCNIIAIRCRIEPNYSIMMMAIQITPKQQRSMPSMPQPARQPSIIVNSNSKHYGNLAQGCGNDEHLKVLSHTTNTKFQNFATATLKFGSAKCSYPSRTCEANVPLGPRHLARAL